MAMSRKVLHAMWDEVIQHPDAVSPDMVAFVRIWVDAQQQVRASIVSVKDAMRVVEEATRDAS
jgi:hypothetical protein